jgi:isopenicillin N synthase-like dioxygenase
MNIPIINYRYDDAAEQFVDSIRRTGFAVLTNTTIQKHLINDVYRDFRIFFGNKERKEAMLFNPETQAGFFPMKSEKAKDSTVQDLKEFFHYFPNARPKQNHPSGFAIGDLCLRMEVLGEEILNWLQAAYEKETGRKTPPWAEMIRTSPSTLFRALHYPPLTGSEDPGAVRSAAHEDINFITFLPAATQSGLQVKDRDGNWHAIETDANSIVVNIGDMLQLLTDGFYPSTTHRVVNPTTENVSRYSMPLFLHPHPETQLSPNKTAKQYLMERLKELGLIK